MAKAKQFSEVVSFVLSSSLRDRLKSQAERERRTMSNLIRIMLDDNLPPYDEEESKQ